MTAAHQAAVVLVSLVESLSPLEAVEGEAEEADERALGTYRIRWLSTRVSTFYHAFVSAPERTMVMMINAMFSCSLIWFTLGCTGSSQVWVY